MVKNYAKARDDLGLTGTGKKVKPAVFNAIGKVFERMTKMGLVDGVTRADGSFQVTRIKGNTITPEDTNKLNALYNKAIQTGDVRKASALMQKGLEALGSDIDNKNKKQKRRGNTRTVPGDFFGRVSGVKKDAIIKSNKTGKTYKVIDILPNGELKIQQQ